MKITRHIKISYATLMLVLGICAIFGLGLVMYEVFPQLAAEDPMVWIILPTLIVAVVSALFVFGIFLGYFYRNPTTRWLTNKKTRKHFKDALAFERGERIRLERQLYETKNKIVSLKDQLSDKGKSKESSNSSVDAQILEEFEQEKQKLEKNQDRLKSDLALRKERIADLLAEIAIAQSEVVEAHNEIEQLKKKSFAPERNRLESASQDASLREVLEEVAALDGIHLALVADDFGLVVESSEPGSKSEKLAAVSSLISRESEKIKDYYDIGMIETISLGDDQGFYIDNTYFQLFKLRCALSIIRDKSNAYPGLAEETIEAIVSRLEE